MSRQSVHRVRDALGAGFADVALPNDGGEVVREVRGHDYIIDA